MNAMVGRVSQRYVYVPLNVVNDKNQPVVRETSRMYNRMIRATGQVSQRVGVPVDQRGEASLERPDPFDAHKPCFFTGSGF